MKKNATLFVHGRPSAHPLHERYGRSVADTLCVEDPIWRWHDRSLPAPLRYLAWIINAFYFVTFSKRVIITEGLRITLVLARLFSFGRIRLIALVDDESPYFIHSKYYGALSLLLNRWAYRQYDGWICIGRMETELVKSIVGNHPNIRTGFNGISSALSSLGKIEFDPASYRVVFVGHCSAPWRAWYKGLDLAIDAVDLAMASNPKMTFDIGGGVPESVQKQLLKKVTHADRIHFVGPVKDLYTFFSNASLYLHPGRGEAWGISINEAMAAGVVPVVSEWTGARECVEQVDQRLVVPLSVTGIHNTVLWFFSLSAIERTELSQKSRLITRPYTADAAVEAFSAAWKSLA